MISKANQYERKFVNFNTKDKPDRLFCQNQECDRLGWCNFERFGCKFAFIMKQIGEKK